MYSGVMTKEKADSIIGRLMVEYSEAKRQVNLHHESLKEAGFKLEPLPFILKRGEAGKVLELLRSVDLDDLKSTSESLIVARGKYENLRDQLRDCGVSV